MRISDWSSDVCSSDLARAVERGYLVIAARGAGLDLGRHAANVALRLGQAAKGFRLAALHFLNLLVQFGDPVGLALVGVGIEEARVLAERAHPFGDAALRQDRTR